MHCDTAFSLAEGLGKLAVYLGYPNVASHNGLITLLWFLLYLNYKSSMLSILFWLVA
jgi:hypothetical protein